MAEKPSVPMGPSIGTPSRGFRPLNTASYRSANEWLKIAAEQTKTLDLLGKAWVTRQEELNKAAAEAGTVAAIKGEARSEMKKNGGLFAKGHREAAYDMTVGQQKAALFESERRRAAKVFGLDPSKRAADWEAEAERMKQQFITDHNINTELSVISFNNELTKHNTQHFNIFRSANVAAMGQATEDLAFDQSAAGIRKLMDGGGLVDKPHTPSGVPIPLPWPSGSIPIGPGVVQTQKQMEKFAEDKWSDEARVTTTVANWKKYIQDNFGDTLDTPQMNRLYKRLADHELSRSDLAYHQAVVTKDEGKMNDAFADYSFTYDVINSLTKTLTDPKGVEQEVSVWDAETQLALRTAEAKLDANHTQNLQAAPEALVQEVRDAFTQLLPALDNLFKSPEGWITDPDKIVDILRTADPLTVSGSKILLPEITRSDTALYQLSAMVRDKIFAEKEREIRLANSEGATEERTRRSKSQKYLRDLGLVIRTASAERLMKIQMELDALLTQVTESQDQTQLYTFIATRERQLQLYESAPKTKTSHGVSMNAAIASPAITKALQAAEEARVQAAFNQWLKNTAKTNERFRNHLAAGGDIDIEYLNILAGNESLHWKPPRSGMHSDIATRHAMLESLYNTQALQVAIEDAHLKVFEDKLNEKDSNGSFVISDQQLTDWGMVDKDGKPNRSMPALDGRHPGIVAFIDSIEWSQLDLWRHVPGNEDYTAKEGPNLAPFLSTDLSAARIKASESDAPSVPMGPAVPPTGTPTTSKEGVSKEGVSKEGVSEEGVSEEGVSEEYNFGAVDAKKLLDNKKEDIDQLIVSGQEAAQRLRDRAQNLVTSTTWSDFFGGPSGEQRLLVSGGNLVKRALQWFGRQPTDVPESDRWIPALADIQETPLPPRGFRTFWGKITGAPSTAVNPQIQTYLEQADALDKDVAMLKLVRSSADRNTVRFGGLANWQRVLFWQVQENIKNKTFNDTDASLADENNSEATYHTGTRDFFKAGRGSWVTDVQNVTTLWGGLNASIFGRGNGVDQDGNRVWLNEEQTLNAINADWVSYTKDETTGKFYQLSLMARRRGKNTPETLARYMTLVLSNQKAMRTVKKFPDEYPLVGFQLPQRGKTTAQTRQDAVRVYGEPRPSLWSTFSRRSPREKRRAQSWQKFALPSEFAEEYPEETGKIMKSLQRATAALVNANAGPGGFPVELILVTDKGTAAQLRTAKENVPEWYRDRIFKPPSDGTSLKDANVHELHLLPLPERVEAATAFIIEQSRGAPLSRRLQPPIPNHIPTSILNALTNAEGYGSSK